MDLIFLDNYEEYEIWHDKRRNIFFFELCRLNVHISESISDGKSGPISKKNPEFVWLNVTSFRSASYKYPNLVIFGVPCWVNLVFESEFIGWNQ